MKDVASQPIHLADYQPPAYLVETVELSFTLAPEGTRVKAALQMRANPAADPGQDLWLNGETLRLLSIALDGEPLPLGSYLLTTEGLTLPAQVLPEAGFTLETEVEIDPAANTALEGLYMSNGMYCTQCEAEGFRKITYYPDRPDVMAKFTVHIESDLPVLLSNGNQTEVSQGRTTWVDPWPKPAYLFALVAGDLVAHRDRFTTASGREVALAIWVRPGDETKCAYAMDALKRSMRWDETEYGREYDLDVFNIVAVDDFNMGAMENKGLNIFNSKYVLASPDTATDADFANIEAIVAHEYFHNWTGNRITCRDWFQLCLKEGLTVFRDQQFSADMRSEPVQRIKDVQALRGRQFREDAGPLAHNVRPESYVEINNFYTATVYEKGAELIRMLRLLVGAQGYSAALDLYFERHDGQACTIEDWIAVFEDVTGRDLSQFKRWYSQAGTPKVTASWRVEDSQVHLSFAQEVPPTPGQPLKEPAEIPVLFALYTPDGTCVLPETLTVLNGPSLDLVWNIDDLEGPVAGEIVPALLRGFSAPVTLDAPYTNADRLVLLAHDSDPFNRWEAGRTLMRRAILAQILDQTPPEPALFAAIDRLLADDALDPAFQALALALPTEDDLAQAVADEGAVPDPSVIHTGRQVFRTAMAEALQPRLAALYDALDPGPDYSPDADQAAKRALRNAALSLLSLTQGPDRAWAQYRAATNMTDQMAAFLALLEAGETDVAEAFLTQWQDDRLVMDKWFMAQISHADPSEAVETAIRLTEHPLFDAGNPNRFRSVIGGLTAGNPAGFHDPSGAGYAFLADWLLKLDAKNPQTAARMSTAFETWRRYDADRQGLISEQLDRIAGHEGLSRDLGEMVERMQGA